MASGTEKPRRMCAAEIQSTLAAFTGTARYYRHFTNMHYTEGVHFLAEAAGAYWLIDLIASWQSKAMNDSSLAEFQLWKLHVADGRAVAICYRDSDDEAFRQEIDYTDFPLRDVSLYVEGGVLLLPSEH
ncbi:MAG: hypothetical protein M3Q69_00610 [Acidobacteriota bacterium]|nr:hypothetical protein [Acidobacteriota bacterium]